MSQVPTQQAVRAPADRGQAAVAGLTELIASAIQSSDEELVTRLDRILRDVEAMIEESQQGSTRLPGESQHRRMDTPS